MEVLYFLTRNFTFIVYALLIISFVIGIKVAPGKQLHAEKGFSLEVMTSLKGIMALFVLCHHISQKKLFQQTHTIPIFEFIGFLFVGIFFFCSGYGLYKSFSTKENYLANFPRKRILPIAISYFVMIAIYAVYYLIVGNNFTHTQWILKLSGLILINSQSWYVYVIILMYFAFYLIYKNEKLRKDGVFLLLVVALVQGALFIFNGHFPWWLGAKDWWKNGGLWSAPWWKTPLALLFEGEWWVNSTVAFAFGVFIAEKEKAFIDWIKNSYWTKLFLITLIFAGVTYAGIVANWNIGYWSDVGGDLGFWKKTVMYLIQCIQIITTCLWIIVVMQKCYVSNGFYRFYGKCSLEVYLIQEMILFSWAYLIEKGMGPQTTPIIGYANWNAAVYAILVFLTVSVSAIVYHWINTLATKPLKK